MTSSATNTPDIPPRRQPPDDPAGHGGRSIPFAPVVYEHAARFLGRSPWEVSRDPDLLYQAHLAAWLAYRHPVVTVGIDIYNLEAEAYGAVVERPDGNGVPAIHRPLLASPEQGLALQPPDPGAGRIAMTIAAARRLKDAHPGIDVRVPVGGPFSIAFNLLGANALCEQAALEPEGVAHLLRHLAENQAPLCRAVAGAGLDIAFFESAAAPPMLSPAQFRELELPALRRVLDIAAACVGHPVPCVMGGDTYPVLQDILSTGTGFVICNIETDQRRFVEAVCRSRPQVQVRVNMDPVVIAGPPERIRLEVDRILSFAGGRPNCQLGTGALAYDVPPESVRLIREYAAGG